MYYNTEKFQLFCCHINYSNILKGVFWESTLSLFSLRYIRDSKCKAPVVIEKLIHLCTYIIYTSHVYLKRTYSLRSH